MGRHRYLSYETLLAPVPGPADAGPAAVRGSSLRNGRDGAEVGIDLGCVGPGIAPPSPSRVKGRGVALVSGRDRAAPLVLAAPAAPSIPPVPLQIRAAGRGGLSSGPVVLRSPVRAPGRGRSASVLR